MITKINGVFLPSPVALPAAEVRKAVPQPSGTAQQRGACVLMRSNFNYFLQGLRLEAKLLLIKQGERQAHNISIGLHPLSTETVWTT